MGLVKKPYRPKQGKRESLVTWRAKSRDTNSIPKYFEPDNKFTPNDN